MKQHAVFLGALSTFDAFAAFAAFAAVCFLALCLGACRVADAQEPAILQGHFVYDANRAASLGIRKLEGRRISLLTDLPTSPEVDELPKVFDAALPHWEAFFQHETPNNWKVQACVMKDRAKFVACGLLPHVVPSFRDGFTLGMNVWAVEQPSDYYRRHLLLHEGTHAYMLMASRGQTGPAWYFEGVAELLGTHRWEREKLTMGVVPENSAAVPHWGRVRVVRDAFDAGAPLSLVRVMNLEARDFAMNVDTYAWAWAAAAFFHHHPAYTSGFRSMLKETHRSRQPFNSLFYQRNQGRWALLAAEWQHYVTAIDYGYDVAREAIDVKAAAPLPTAKPTAKVTLKADRGWQSTGLRLAAGKTYRLRATGRFQVDDEPKPWMSEANGVTLRYHAGRPVGVLLAAVHDPAVVPHGLCTLCKPLAVGADATWKCGQDGVLYLRVNEAPNQLADNRGELMVEVHEAP